MTKAGFTILGQDHPISPVFLGDEKVALELSQRMLDEGIFVIAFAYPVVPKVRFGLKSYLVNKFQFRVKHEFVSKFLLHIPMNKSKRQLQLSQNVQKI